jgi:predicted DCC family thiol-disulfide oxidoreductase YuxK
MNSMTSRVDAGEHPILLYDGVCGLCNRLVQFTLRHDHKDQFRFATLQGPFAAQILARHDASTDDLNTFYVVTSPEEPNERLWARSDAAIVVLDRLGGFWKPMAEVARLLPRFIRDAVYNLIARNRYRVFGKFDQCPLPDPRYRHRFLDE